MVEVRVTGFELAGADAGPNHLGRFSVVVGPIELRGCALRLRRDGLPHFFAPRPVHRVGIRIVDPEVADRVTDAALAAFKALGGVLPAR